jgi:outer membrane receptor protein involved in Fe transport
VLHPALPTPVEFLDTPREAYNWPEQNSNRLAFLTLQGRHALGAQQLIAGNLYLRRLSSENLTSDTNSDPELANQGVNTLGTAEQLGWGGGAQYSGEFGSTGNRHELALGLGVDMGSIDYQQLIQPANFDSQRGSTVLLGPYSLIAPGATSGANLRTGSQRFGVYAADTWSPGESWHFSASARYDHAELRLEDLSGTRPALNGINDFARVNPALGLTYAAAPELTLYAAANQGMRTPSPVELSCADPNQPCAIPANFLADPPLKAVIARTLELGARGRLPGNGDALAWVWHGAVFRTRIQDDIRFVNAPTSITQTGFFQNIGSTLREGLEAGLSWQGQQWAASAEYSYIRAVFDSAYSELSVNNSARDANGNIQIPAGASIPQVPRHNLKLHADWSPVSGSRLGAVMQAYSQQYARGDENNADVHGTLGGFALWALQGETRLAPGWSATMDVENLFDRHFQSYGQLGSNLFTGPGRSFDATNANPTLFVSPGTARRITLGLRWQT